ncbi:glycosyltransferase [Sporomusa carbonis]|uniref:glycosyltransferase n=1 Tax=Sporomusa carbonis TaxID=3076075 RepID=UPI003C7CC79B
MIVRNEEAYIARCLESVRHLVNEIIIVDTGSTDNTLAVARRYTSKIYSFPWQNDFGKARNFALDKCTGNWILSLDADETVDASQGTFRALIENHPESKAFLLPLYYQSNKTVQDDERCFVLRFFRNLPEHRFVGKVHEQIPFKKLDEAVLSPTPKLRHHQVSRKERNRRRHRNLMLLETSLRQEPDNLIYQYYSALEWQAFGRYIKSLAMLKNVYTGLSDTQATFRSHAARQMLICLRTLGRNREAATLCEEVSARYPTYTDLYFEGGLVSEQMGKFEIACHWFERALASGLPPDIFIHTAGTNGFLSYYHLGYCQERLGNWNTAISAYQQALSENPAYIAPLYHLFHALSRKLPITKVLDHFQAAGCLQQPQQNETLANLFFVAGYAEIAVKCACLHQTHSPPAALFRIYAGQPEQARSYYKNLSSEKCLPSVAEIIACILCGDLTEAKHLALDLWKKSDTRNAAWTLLSLIALYKNEHKYICPEQTREPEVITATLGILDKCFRHSLAGQKQAAALTELAYHCIRLLKERTRTGIFALAMYFQEKEEAWAKVLKDMTLASPGMAL